MSLIPTTSPATIAFVLDNIAAYETILSSIDKETQVFVINSTQDALQQMATIASGFSGLDAVHVFSHGSSGSLDFGQTKLTNTTLSSYAPQLLEIGSSLSPNGDILLYGCSVAEGQMGIDFMGRLSEMTGADIAASEDATGSALLGGDMVLEQSVGSVEAEVLQVTINTLLLYELESNNTLATATTSTLGTAMLGQLSSISDVDYFKYTVGSSGILSISYDDPINDYESAKISVYNSAGALLTSQSGSYDISVSAAALSAGDYYVTVSNSYGSGQYSLTTTHVAGSVSNYESESNNTLATATTSTLGTAMLGQLSSISDVDYFKYTVGSSGILSISYDDPINDYESAKISVYNSAGALLTSQSGSYDISVSAAALSAGDYYVTVSNSYGSGQYSLTTTHVANNTSTPELEIDDDLVDGGASDLPALQFSQSIENGEIVLSISTNEWSSGSNTLNFTLNYDSSMGNFDRYETGGNGAYSVSSSTTVVGSSGTLRFNSTINNYGDETDIVKLIFTPTQSNTNLTYTASSIYVNSVNYGVVYLEDGINTAPTITSNSTGSVAENAPITTVIYDANATDVDAGTTLSYSLSGTDASLLNINSSNGEVTLKASADYETKNSYSFNVVASDGSLSDTQAVTVTVTDVDETPTEPTPEPEPETIATRVSASFVESIQTELGVSLNMLIEATMTARLRLMIENNTYSKLAASIAIQNFSSEIREVVGTNQRDFMDRAGLLMEDIQTSVETDFRDETAALFASNNIEAQTASTQNELIITLAGLTTSEDTSLNTIADVNALFGTGTIA